jgi:hypothetical protein
MTGKVPFCEQTDHSVMFIVALKKEHPERPENHIPTNSQDGNKLWNLLIDCWSFEPKARPSAAAVAEVVSRFVVVAFFFNSDADFR